MIIERAATVKDFNDFMVFGRPEDHEEIEAVHGIPFKDISLTALKGTRALVHQETGELLGLGGYEFDFSGSDEVLVWLVMTDFLQRHKMEFLRYSLKRRDELLKDKKVIFNMTLKKNKLHIDWLRWLGAEFEEVPGQPEFILFAIRKKEV